LCPYRVKGRYVYYECKNLRTGCGVLVPQAALVEQLPALLSVVGLAGGDLEILRAKLLEFHERRSQTEIDDRREVNAENKRVVREIGDVFSQRKDAEALGVLDAVDLRLTELRAKRDELQARLNACHEQGTDWVEKAVRSFRLIELLQEAIFYGSRRPRELVLRAIASNYSVEGKRLVPELRSPFRQCAQRRGHPEWWSELYGVRTETGQTYDLLRSAELALEQERLLSFLLFAGAEDAVK
jgi:hypothetical protein